MNTQSIGTYYLNQYQTSHWYLIKSESGQYDMETIQNHPFTEMQLNEAEFNKNDEESYEIWNIDGIFGIYNQNLELVQEYKDMNALMQDYWNRPLGFITEEMANEFNEFDFNCK